MASGRHSSRLHQLWQLPLLIASLGLFGTAAYLFVNPGTGLTIDQKIGLASTYLRFNRPEAARDQLNKLLTTEKLTRENEGRVRLLLGESLELEQKQRHISVPVNHERIIEQTKLALAQGVKPEPEVYRRLGESYEALGKTPEALENYRRAMAIDPRREPSLQRKVIDLQLTLDDTAPAEASIEEFLKNEKLADAEKAWALGKKAELLMKRGNNIEAKALLTESLRLNIDPVAQGEANYRLGYCLWRLNDSSEAERRLRLARDLLKSGHPMDADAAYLLGKINQDQNHPKEAAAFYQDVLVGHPESRVAPLSHIGRGECRLLIGEDAGGLSDLHDVVAQLVSEKLLQKYKPDALAALRRSEAVLSGQEKLEGALELFVYEQQLEPDPPADFFARLAAAYERRGDQLNATAGDAATAAEKIQRQQQVRQMLTHAGDAWIAYSRAVTLDDDKGHAAAMWKGVELYDRAGDLQRVTSALELFAAERPNDGQTPDAILRLGRAYQAAGMFDKAISAFQRNQLRYPQSLAASKSGVPLAQAYIAKGPDYYGKAEKVLLGVVDNNPLIGPDAEEFGQALFELAQLFYRTERYEEAVVRLEEMTARYPNDPRMPQLLFLMADSYRKSALALTAKADASQAAKNEALTARRERLTRAKKYYDRIVEIFHDNAPTADLDKLYLKLSHFYRADCLYDLGEYEEAIHLYDAAALRYQDDPWALSANVQVVNAWCALGRPQDAKHANERAKTLLARMPADAFKNGAFPMPKEYFERWLNWASMSGMWNPQDERLARQKLAGGNNEMRPGDNK